MGVGGFEPPTLDLKDQYSIQLSYTPKVRSLNYTLIFITSQINDGIRS